MYPVIVRVGPFTLYSYGLMMALGFLVSWPLLRKELRRKNLPQELARSIVVAAIIGGVVGARAYSILGDWQGFLHNPLGGILSGTGLAWYGGLIGGTAASLYVIRRNSVSVRQVIDAAAPLLALGYAFGKMGCFLAGDGDYGPPTDLPWAMAFPNGLVPPTHYGFEIDARLHPTPLYEVTMSLSVFLLLWSIRKRESPPGSVFSLYLVLAGAERFIAEFWRLTPKIFFGLSMARLLSMMAIVLGTVLWFKLRRSSDSPGVEELHL